MTAYYNEFDPFAAQWLRELIEAGHIPAGDVDERDIREVQPDDVRGYTQCHFFAGIGGWPYALRLAGWPDDRPAWTGSPPCQPFSAAGKGLGTKDERHLAPVWLTLVGAVRPVVVFGEQVAAAVNKDAWLDDLLDALEGAGYATGAAVAPACGIGAPHIRQRLWFVAQRLGNNNTRPQRWPGVPERANQQLVGGRSLVSGLAKPDNRKCRRRTEAAGRNNCNREDAGRQESDRGVAGCGATDWVDNTTSTRHIRTQQEPEAETRDEARVRVSSKGCRQGGLAKPDGPGPQPRSEAAETSRHRNPSDPESGADQHEATGAARGEWDNPDWLYCRDGKWRPVEPGTFPLADGIPARVGRLRGYGNAIVPQVAAEIIRVVMEAEK